MYASASRIVKYIHKQYWWVHDGERHATNHSDAAAQAVQKLWTWFPPWEGSDEAHRDGPWNRRGVSPRSSPPEKVTVTREVILNVYADWAILGLVIPCETGWSDMRVQRAFGRSCRSVALRLFHRTSRPRERRRGGLNLRAYRQRFKHSLGVAVSSLKPKIIKFLCSQTQFSKEPLCI